MKSEFFPDLVFLLINTGIYFFTQIRDVILNLDCAVEMLCFNIFRKLLKIKLNFSSQSFNSIVNLYKIVIDNTKGFTNP